MVIETYQLEVFTSLITPAMRFLCLKSAPPRHILVLHPRNNTPAAIQQRHSPVFLAFLAWQIEVRLRVGKAGAVGGKASDGEEQTSRLRASEFYQIYQRWGRLRNHTTCQATTPCAFGWQLRKLKMELDRTDPLQDILFKRKESVGHTYLVNWAKLETYLKTHGAMYEGWHGEKALHTAEDTVPTPPPDLHTDDG